MKTRTTSNYTWFVFAAALVIAGAAFALVRSGLGGEFGAAVFSDIGGLLIIQLAAVMILTSAARIGVGSPVGRTWLLIGLGSVCFFLGDAVYTAIEVGMQAEPSYPGIADIFYLLEYPLVAAGIISAGLAYKGLVPLKRPAFIASGVAVVLAAVVYLGFLQPYILFDPEVSLAEKAISTAYPLADIFVMIVPAVFVLAVVAKLGGGRLAWQWWAVAAGAVLLAITDTAYAWLEWAEVYQSGSFIDWGWSLGHVLMMLGALIATDLTASRS